MGARRGTTVLVATALALVAVCSSSVLAKGDGSYGPPYRNGSQGGDRWNYVSADRSTGHVSVFRLNPIPGEFGCGGQGGFATLRVLHELKERARGVTVRYEDALVDGYSWITVVATTASDRWLGAKQVRGPLEGSGTVKVSFGKRSPARGRITVEFGIQVASACPNVNGGSATFTKVRFR